MVKRLSVVVSLVYGVFGYCVRGSTLRYLGLDKRYLIE